MSYAQSTRQDRRALRVDAGRPAAAARAGTFTYVVFALSIGFAIALVLGIVA